jgi:hypothetical protein
MPRLVETIPTPAISNGLSPTGGGPAVSLTVIATAIHVVAAAGLGGMAGLLGAIRGWRWISRDPAAWVSSMAWISKRRRAPP